MPSRLTTALGQFEEDALETRILSPGRAQLIHRADGDERPSLMMPMRSQSRSATSRMCVEKKTVFPDSQCSFISCLKRWLDLGSRPTIGSSRINRGGVAMSAPMRASFCRMPWE